MGLGYAVLAVGAMLLFAPQCAMLFLNQDEADLARLVSLTSQYITTLTAFFFPLALVNIVRFSIQGMGFSQLAILAGVLEMAARTVMGQVFVPLFGFTAACFASPVAWISADLFLIPAAILCIRHLRKLYPDQTEEAPSAPSARKDRNPIDSRPRRKSAWAFPFVKKSPPVRLFPKCGSPGIGRGGVQGKETRAVKRSAWVSTWNRPPQAWTKLEAMDSPRPLPPSVRLSSPDEARPAQQILGVTPGHCPLDEHRVVGELGAQLQPALLDGLVHIRQGLAEQAARSSRLRLTGSWPEAALLTSNTSWTIPFSRWAFWERMVTYSPAGAPDVPAPAARYS